MYSHVITMRRRIFEVNILKVGIGIGINKSNSDDYNQYVL